MSEPLGDERLVPATQAGREYHDSLHEPGGPYEAITGRAGCGGIGCGSLSWIVAIEREAAASQGDEGRGNEVRALAKDLHEFAIGCRSLTDMSEEAIHHLDAAVLVEFGWRRAASQGDEGLREARLHRHKCGDCGEWLANLDEAVPTLLAELDALRAGAVSQEERR